MDYSLLLICKLKWRVHPTAGMLVNSPDRYALHEVTDFVLSFSMDALAKLAAYGLGVVFCADDVGANK